MSDRSKEFANKVITKCEENGDIVCGNDGYYVYWPAGGNGALNEAALRVLADHLDKINDDWDRQVQQL